MSGHIFDGTLPFSCKKSKKNLAGPTSGECSIASGETKEVWSVGEEK